MKRPDSIKSFKLFESEEKSHLSKLYKFLKRPGGYEDFIKRQSDNPYPLDQKRTGRIYYSNYGGRTFTDYKNNQYTLESVYGGSVRYYYRFDTKEELEKMLVTNTVSIGAYLVKKQVILNWLDDPKNYKEFFKNGYTKKDLAVKILTSQGEEILELNLADLLMTNGFKRIEKSDYNFSINLNHSTDTSKAIKVGHYINPLLDFLRYKPEDGDFFHANHENFLFDIKIVPIRRRKKSNERWIGETKALVRDVKSMESQNHPGGFNFIIINDADPELIVKDMLHYYFRMQIGGIGKDRIDKIADSDEMSRFVLEINADLADSTVENKPAKNVVATINDMIAKEPNKMVMLLKSGWNELKKNPILKGIKGNAEFMKNLNLVGDLDSLGL